MTKFLLSFLVAFSLLILMACQPQGDSKPVISEPAPTSAATSEAQPTTPAATTADTPFNFTQALNDYTNGEHDELVNYLNKGITEIIKGSKSVKGNDLGILKKSIEDLKILSVKIRRNHFKERPFLENAIARMEINQARNYLILAKQQAVKEPAMARVNVAKAIQKMEYNISTAPPAFTSVMQQKVEELETLLTQPEAAFVKDIAKSSSSLSKWISDNKGELGIAIPPK